MANKDKEKESNGQPEDQKENADQSDQKKAEAEERSTIQEAEAQKEPGREATSKPQGKDASEAKATETETPKANAPQDEAPGEESPQDQPPAAEHPKTEPSEDETPEDEAAEGETPDTEDQPQKEAPQRKHFPVVGVGASAGGLEALEQFVSGLPEKSGIAFVIVTHTHPDYPTRIPELLKRNSPVKFVLIEDGIKVEQDTVYVPPSDQDAIIENGVLRLQDRSQCSEVHLPIDIFLRSLAEERGDARRVRYSIRYWNRRHRRSPAD